MPLRSKLPKSDITIEDVIGESQQTPAVKPTSTPAPVVSPQNPVQNTVFVPRLVSSPTSSQISTLNGTDRYAPTPTQNVKGYLDTLNPDVVLTIETMKVIIQPPMTVLIFIYF